MMKTTKTILLAMALMASGATLQAAVVTWQAPSNITADTDVATTGSLIGAFIPGANALSTTVNGVAFSSIYVANDWNNTSTLSLSFGSVATLAGAPSLYGFGQYEGGTPSGLSADYTKLFSGGVGPATTTNYMYLTLNNLTIGTQYLFQSWANESRGRLDYRNETITANTFGGSQSGELAYNVGGGDGGKGSFVIGTFTADATTQTMLYSSIEFAQINAFQVRAVPEPSTYALVVGGIATLILIRRRVQA